jgi:hypothetical protein
VVHEADRPHLRLLVVGPGIEVRSIKPSLKHKFFTTACRIPAWWFVVVVKTGKRTPPEGRVQEKTCRNI